MILKHLFANLKRYYAFFLLPLLFIGCYSSWCAGKVIVSQKDLGLIADMVFFNECGEKLDLIVCWNEGEDFMSLGLGHFIWYQKEAGPVNVIINPGFEADDAPVSGVDPSMGQRVQEALDAVVAEFKVPGAVLGIRDVDGNTRFWTSGTADLKSGKPMSKDLYFRIVSVTKSYTATMVLQLVDEGKISLDDPIGKHLPGLVPRENKITIRHLLEMRSGLGSYGTNEEFAKMAEAQPGRVWTPEELIRLSSSTIGDPGRDFDYNNANYILLGLLIEKVTNDSFRNQVIKGILQPPAMSHTFVPTDMEMPAPFAHGYLVEDGKVVDGTDCLHPTAAWSAGNIISTAGDQLIWAKALVEDRLLSPQVNAERFIMSPMVNKPGLYGLGVLNLDGIIGHGGN